MKPSAGRQRSRKIADILASAHDRPTAGDFDDCPRVPYALNVAIAGLLFLLALGLAFHPALFDLPLMLKLNSLAGRYPALDLLFYDLDNSYTFSGAVVMALVWGCWFSNEDRVMRTRILSGTAASFVVGVVSRQLQHRLPTHLRPFYNPAVHFHYPLFMSRTPFNTWYSFPSDHVAFFVGLLTVAWFAGSNFRIPATVWLILVESTRSYEGAHFPSDLAGGAALAVVLVWASQSPACLRLAHRVMRFEISTPSLFYIVAFFVSFQLATLFTDLRNDGSAFRQLYYHGLSVSQRQTRAPSG